MHYDFLSPTRIVFGWGRRAELGKLARGLGTRVLLVSGSRTLERIGVIDELALDCTRHGVEVLRFPVASRNSWHP